MLHKPDLLLEVGGYLIPAECHVTVDIDLLEHVHGGGAVLGAVIQNHKVIDQTTWWI